MIRLIFCLALLSVSANAQLQIALYDGAAERTLSSLTDLGNTAMGDASEYRFRARNAGVAGIALQSVSVSGQAFSLSDKPSLPYIVAPGNFAEFRVRFYPLAPGSYSAALTVNGVSSLLRASASAAPVLSVTAEGPASVIAAGSPVDFGRILKKASVTRTFRLANSAAVTLSVSSVTVSGQAFRGPLGLTVPAELRPGDALEFTVNFEPSASGQFSGTLNIDGRVFTLTGVAYEPPLPPPTIALSTPQSSASQGSVSVRFDEIPGTTGSGTLTLDFSSAVPGITDDPAILFLNSGSRRLSFTVAEGDAVASFSGLREIPFQTGTTAGTVTLTVQIAGYTSRKSFDIAAAPVSVDAARASRRVNDIDVTVTGFDNTRTSGLFTFTFYDRSGKAIAPGAIQVDSTADFARYFAISRAGGWFLMRATFPVTGDAAQVGAVDVEVANRAGKTRPARLNLQ